jgi:pimeloyl-ACP methyl ester carboxylesterase
LYRRIALALVVLVACMVAGLGALRLAAHLRETDAASAAAPADGKIVESGHGRMFVMDPGPADGIFVVLFHGTAAWSKLWWRTTAALKSDGYRPIVPDLPPFGYSEQQGGYTRLEQAARIDGMMMRSGRVGRYDTWALYCRASRGASMGKATRDRLRELGYTEGRDIVLEARC